MELVQRLIVRSCKLGAKGVRVVGWMPPVSASDNPEGTLITMPTTTPETASQLPWYDC